MKRILINKSLTDELRIALVDGARLFDLDGETNEIKILKGSIFKAKVSRVETSLDAAFVFYGAERHGFLPLKELTDDFYEKEFDNVFNVNAKSVYFSGKYFVPKMKKIKKGVILNVASTAGLSPRPKLNWYNASKGWMITATKAMAIELAPYNVRVNAIAPVAGKTPLLKSFMGGNSRKKKQAFLSTIPIGRFSTPLDMGNAACFLCSDEASMITGTILEVDGGRCI